MESLLEVKLTKRDNSGKFIRFDTLNWCILRSGDVYRGSKDHFKSLNQVNSTWTLTTRGLKMFFEEKAKTQVELIDGHRVTFLLLPTIGPNPVDHQNTLELGQRPKNRRLNNFTNEENEGLDNFREYDDFSDD